MEENQELVQDSSNHSQIVISSIYGPHSHMERDCGMNLD